MSNDELQLRLAQPDDARNIGVLCRRVVKRWVVPDQSADVGRALLSRLSASVVRQRIIDGQRFHLAYVGNVLVGVAAMRDDSHLLHFYVSTRYQGRGIARRLWQSAMGDAIRRAGTRCFTLNATPCAVPVYLRLGFHIDGAERPSPSGVLTTPMSLQLPVQRSQRA
ncbi:GNAT family N-acetyltransferase [Dyella monticola]|uniref:GNAT family N-acetyltransferase n=1 Tax=Dyella monticola TaxID=1927958 RepID=A0A370X4I5_9GAMM|nr:GNAT family N-acetyltransferase [Dyella monticola]RDS83125.1 GNAT family N-acetyltransferase [Dyella monticola]